MKGHAPCPGGYRVAERTADTYMSDLVARVHAVISGLYDIPQPLVDAVVSEALFQISTDVRADRTAIVESLGAFVRVRACGMTHIRFLAEPALLTEMGCPPDDLDRAIEGVSRMLRVSGVPE